MTQAKSPEPLVDIESAVQSVLAEGWYWFPVRHHSPSVAFQLQAAIRARRPKLVLIEGPTEANRLLPNLIDRKTRPPIAIYSSFQDDQNTLGLAGIASPAEEIPPRWACWFPFVEYSPELVAIREAAKLKAEIRFMDLPHYARLPDEVDSIRARNEPETENVETADAERHSQTERLIAESEFYQALAGAGGYKSWDEGWDALFEFRTFDDVEHFRREMLTFCCAARSSCSADRIARDGTLQRERFMLKTIREAIAACGVADDEVMVVCGGFHAFLDRTDASPAPEIPVGTVYTTIVPYTWFRISDLSGYGAGNRAPQFYQRHWDALAGKIDNPEADYVVTVLQQGRKLGERLSSADAISIAQHAQMLSALRGRSRPLLDDLQDAIITCCCKGDPHEQGVRIQKAIDQVNIGNRVGRVADNAPRLPIVDDFYHQLERLDLLGLVDKEQKQKLELDKRQPDQFEASAIFHRMEFIEVPFCQQDGGPNAEFDSGLIFRETWHTKWSPEVEAKLIEQNLLGDSLEAAAIHQLRKMIAENPGQAGAICRTLVSAVQMDLPNLIDQIFDSAVEAIDEDPKFVSLCEAVAQLSVLDRYAMHHEMKRSRIAAMTQRAYARACFSMIDIANAPDDHHPQIIDGLTTLADVALKAEEEEQRALFAQYVEITLAECSVPFLKGALLGLTVEIRLRPHTAVSGEILAFAASPQDQMTSAGDFVHGVISVSRASIMAGATELVAALDELLKAAEWDVFVTMLPRLRAGMEMLHARHRDNIATQVAERYGLAEPTSLQHLEVTVDQAKGIVELDQRVAEIMADWSFAK